LIVPREDLDAGIIDGEELDLAAVQAKEIRKPDRREWFVLNRASELPTRLLLHKPTPDGYEVEHYYVAKSLRGPIIDELKEVRVFICYSCKAQNHFLWVVNVTPDNLWYETLDKLLQHPVEFFATRKFRIYSPRKPAKQDGYRVKVLPLTETVVWPGKSTDVLLGEALGPGRLITSVDHPLYRDLIAGEDLA
jgi:hypothetical protein